MVLCTEKTDRFQAGDGWIYRLFALVTVRKLTHTEDGCESKEGRLVVGRDAVGESE
jgi:hypothetical protein